MNEAKAPKSRDELAADQAAFWNGPGGQGWLAAYARIERSLTPFSEIALVAAAAKSGESVIDVGCGTGGTTAALARAVGAAGASGGHVLGVDISQPLIETARAQALANATFVLGDATVQPFDELSVDLVFSRFGVMFFADPVKAFRNLRSALKPDGRLVFLCWRTPQENPWGLVPLRAAQPFLPPIPRPGPEDPGQYSFGDRNRVARILSEAGFGAPSFEPVDRPVWLGNSVAEVVEGSGRFGPLARAFADAAPEAREQALTAIAQALAPHAGANGVTLPGACWLVRAAAQPSA
jgi:SAM-dependent methyltransferase